MNIARTQYIEHDFTGHQTAYQMFLLWFFAGKRFLALLKTVLQNGLVPVVALAVVLVSVVGYVAAINYTMLRGVLLKEVQNEIKIVQSNVLSNEAALANVMTRSSLEKHEAIALMQNVDHVYYISPHTSVADASGYQSIR